MDQKRLRQWAVLSFCALAAVFGPDAWMPLWVGIMWGLGAALVGRQV